MMTDRTRVVITIVLSASFFSWLAVESHIQAVNKNICSNVKIRVDVTGVQEGQKYIGVVALKHKTESRMSQVKENQTWTLLAFNFKSVKCPSIGDEYTGFVNGTAFKGEIYTIKDPNRMSVYF